MKPKRSIVILSLLFGYILLQFLWWEVLLVKQNDRIVSEKQKLIELTSVNDARLRLDLEALHRKKKMQTVMIVGEGTVFLLLLAFGIYKIKQANDRETALNNQQKNFFLSITHELKTPIAATKLQLQTLQKQKLTEVVQQELIGHALLETERLNMLIDNVLLASRLETEEFIFNTERKNLSDFAAGILSRYYASEIGRGELDISIAPGIFSEIDVHAFPSVLTNLVNNALKYSPGKKRVGVELTRAGDMVLLRVKDEGCGIAAGDKPRVFDRFFRAGNEETRNSKGTGLGLYIVKYIVNKHRGRVLVSDNSPQGSVFEVQLHVA